jgi:hypothetical protein
MATRVLVLEVDVVNECISFLRKAWSEESVEGC